MAKIQVNLKLIMTVLFALACGVVAFLYPNWRTDLQAYTYYGYGGYGPRAYVTGAEGVKVVDLDTNLVVGSIGIGSKGGIAISSKGYAYVASCYPLCGVILVIDTATDEVVESISTSGYAGWGPEGIAVSPDGGYVYVTNYDDKSISVIDADSNTVVRNIALGFNPIGIAVHPLGKRLYVANMQNTVSVINTNTYNVIYPPVSVGLRPYGIVVRPDGKFVYVTNYESSTISVIDTSNNTVVDTIDVKIVLYGFEFHLAPTDITINQAGTKLFVAVDDWTSAVIIVIATKTIYEIDVGVFDPNGIALHPAEKLIYITDKQSDSLLVIDIDKKPEQLIAGVSILDPFAVKILGNAPNKPFLSSPSNGATGVSTTPILDWGDVSGATSYDVQVCSNNDCSSVVRSATVSSRQWTVSPALPPGMPYYWRVRANNSCGVSSWTDTWSFTVILNSGDINNDGKVDISDVILDLRIALGLDTSKPCSDINNDGKVDISDVILTLRMALGLDSLKTCTN